MSPHHEWSLDPSPAWYPIRPAGPLDMSASMNQDAHSLVVHMRWEILPSTRHVGHLIVWTGCLKAVSMSLKYLPLMLLGI